MKIAALILLLMLQTHAFANSTTGWWTRVKQAEVVSKLTTKLGAAKVELGRKALLIGASVALACGAMSCDNPVDLGGIADILGEDGSDGDVVVRIGLNHDGTSSRSALHGAELAVAEVNAVNLDKGVQLELFARDSMGSSITSYQLMDELVTVHMVHALVGPSANAFLVAEVAHGAKVPMIATRATNPNITTSSGNYIFLSTFTDIFQGQAIAKFAINELNASSAAVLTQDRNAYSRVLSNNFLETFEATEGNTAIQEFYRAGDTNFSAQLAKIKGMPNVQVVFVAGVVPEVALIVKQAKTMGIDATFIGADGWGAGGLIETGGDALEGSYFLEHFSANDPNNLLPEETLKFIADYSAANNGELPTSEAALAYDAVFLVTQAIASAASLEGAAIRDALAATIDYNGATSILSFTADRHPIKPAVMQTIQGGEIVLYKVIGAMPLEPQ